MKLSQWGGGVVELKQVQPYPGQSLFEEGKYLGFGIVLAAMTIYKYYKKRKVELLNKANEDTLNNIRTER